MKTKGFGKASGKIILIGEHAVVYDEPAVALPFAKTSIETQILPCEHLMIDCAYFQGLLADVPDELLNVKELVYEFLRVIDQEEATFSITISSNIPHERGMGSSAATAISLIRAMSDYFETPLTSEKIKDLADFSEKIAHGNPSGIDVATVSSPQPLLFKKGVGHEHFAMNLKDVYLIVADTGEKGQTRKIVAEVAQLLETQPEKRHHVKKLGELSKTSKEAIIKNDKKQLGEVFNQAHSHLQELGVSNERLDFFVNLACESGALGAKLTGSGRGGCMIVLCDSKEITEKIANKFRQEGVENLWIQEIGVD